MAPSEFDIHALAAAGGHLALSPIPGRSGSYENDLSRVLHWAPSLVLTMTTEAELDRMGAMTLSDDLAAVGVPWVHLPIVDFGAPDSVIQAAWPEVSTQALAVLRAGGRVLVHCFGGCGRSGMAVLRLMIEAGEDPAAALARLRSVRPCAVETQAQQDWAFNGA